MNQKLIKRNGFVQYLGVYIDEKLTWYVHINKLFLQKARHYAMLYQIRDYVTPHTLNMLHYSFVYCSLNQTTVSLSGAQQLKTNCTK